MQPGWIGPSRRGPGSCASISLGVPSRQLGPRPHQPRQRLLRLLEDRRGRARCRSPWSHRAPDISIAPAWAEGPGRRRRQLRDLEPEPSDFADFLRAVASRYSGGFDPDGPGPAPRLPAVQALQVWNEPNLTPALTPQYQGETALSPAHYREMLNAAYAAVKAVDPKMLVVTAGPSPYGDAPAASRPARAVLARAALRARDEEEEEEEEKGASKRVFVRTQNCPAPVRFDVLAHHPINTSGGPRRAAINPDDASSPDLDRIVRVLRGAEARWNGFAGSAPGLGDGVLVGQQPPNSAGAPLGYPGPLDRAGDVPGLAGRRQRLRSTS